MFVYDPMQSQPLQIDASAVLPHGGAVSARLVQRGVGFDLRGMSMGAQVRVAGNLVLDVTLPPSGVGYAAVGHLGSPSAPVGRVLWSTRLRWRPEDALQVSAWIDTRAGREHASANLVAPRPVRPFGSWTWDAGARRWQPPVAYPDDGGFYNWDEAAGAWVPAV